MSFDEQIILNSLGAKIREIRINKGLSQFQFALMCDLPVNQIGRIERAEINTSILTLHKIANAFEINIKELV